MVIAGYLAGATTCVAAVFCFLAIVRAWRTDNSGARRFAKFSMWAAISFIPIMVVAAPYFALSSADAESKATVLARGISESMNCGALSFPTGMVSLVVWIVAKRRESKSAAERPAN
jgi:cytochrome bd-type quinol oxidase subunit 2